MDEWSEDIWVKCGWRRRVKSGLEDVERLVDGEGRLKRSDYEGQEGLEEF